MKRPDELAMKQIERRLKNLSSIAKDTNVRTGWIAYMRQAMFMTLHAYPKSVPDLTGLALRQAMVALWNNRFVS